MLPRGSGVDILFKDESAYGTPPSGNWTRTFIYSHTLEEKQPLEDDNLLGQPRHNDRDAVAPAPGLPTHGGGMVVPLCLNHIGYWLKLGLGAPATTGEDEDYVHVFNSGAATLPSRAIEIKTPVVGGAIYPRHLGVMLDKLSLDVSRAGNFERVNLDLVGKQEVKPLPTASAGGTPVEPLALDRVLATQGIFKIDDVIAQIMSINVTYDNRLKSLDYVGDVYPSGYDSDEDATFAGSLRVRMASSAFYSMAADGTLFAGEILFQKSATRSLSLKSGKMMLERSGFPVAGPGGIEQNFNFRCQQSDDAPMLIATLKSGTATF